MSKKVIEGNPDFVKDENSGAILFINRREVDRHKAKLRAVKEGRTKIATLEQEVDELKRLVTQLLENNKHG